MTDIYMYVDYMYIYDRNNIYLHEPVEAKPAKCESVLV